MNKLWLNGAVLDELASQIGLLNLENVIRTFHMEFTEKWDDLRSAALAGDTAQIQSNTHALVGICRTVGLFEMGEALAAIEARLREGEPLPRCWLDDLEDMKTPSMSALSDALGGR